MAIYIYIIYIYIIRHSYILFNQRCRIGLTKQTKITAGQNHIRNRLYIYICIIFYHLKMLANKNGSPVAQ